AGTQLATNALTGHALTDDLGVATLSGAGAGAVMGAVTAPGRDRPLLLRAAPEPPVLPRAPAPAGALPPVLPAQPPVLPAQPPPLPRAAAAANAEPPPLPRGEPHTQPPKLPAQPRTPPRVDAAKSRGIFDKLDSWAKDINERLTGQRMGMPQ